MTVDIRSLARIAPLTAQTSNGRRALAKLQPFGTSGPVLAPSYPSAGTIITQILYRLGDPNQGIWTSTEIRAYLNQGYDELVSLTGCLWVKSSPSALDDVAGAATYTLPSDLITLERASWKQKRLIPLEPAKLQVNYPAYRTLQGDVYGYIMDLDGLRTFRKVMVPTVTETGNISIEYQRLGNALADSSSQFELPARYVKYIRHYAMWKALERNGKGQDLGSANITINVIWRA